MRTILLICALAAIALGDAAPDQVLVLYNADWTEDLDGSEPGQDSLEVARYYVEQHTDPKTGKKPYLLGLSCKHGKEKHLNQFRLPEGKFDFSYYIPGMRSPGTIGAVAVARGKAGEELTFKVNTE